MIERGSGRTSGLTEWRLMDLLSMWACIQDHDTAGHWKQVAGWRKVCDLSQAHLGRLKEYRRGLAEAWPPATNAAAQAYLGELDDLIKKVQRTHDAAAANYDALAAATRAISSARVELKPLHDEYVTKLQQKRTYEATLADPKAAMGSRVPDKPVTDADLERLNAQARSLMYGLSGELQQAQVMLRQPPTLPKTPRQPDNPDVYANDAPVIPPIAPIPIAPQRSALTKNGPPKRPMAHVAIPQIVGPVLGSASNIPASIPDSPTPASGSSSLPATTSSAMGLPAATRPVVKNPNRPSSSNPPHNQAPAPGHTTKNGDSPSLPNPMRPLAPGGLIGGPPGFGISPPGGTSLPRKVNPVGGIIGGGGAGTAPTGAAGSRPGSGRSNQIGPLHGISPIGGSPGLRATNGQNGRQEQPGEGLPPWDPEHPWETLRGVPPVVRRIEDEGPIDPGPAIGFDR
ncbi:hypothetical protein OOK41_29445 [Micromonospora sp. NBC_01655]|uniref:hypothetical protein n=1 Tax=Micromonospora sp. NBC_01655 TaxID=2975983 RepID=UPI0022517111|nr:hypothetical protein [Micromonospora sp. NBC_01655]MCX4474387.1 hypothetical protein [Micromonospora sp. NBC_01655]